MIHIHNNGDKVFCFVEVGEATVFRTYEGILLYDIECIILPSSHTWHNPKRACDLTEEEKAKIAGTAYDMLPNGLYKKLPSPESFTSLLTSIGMKEETTVVLEGNKK